MQQAGRDENGQEQTLTTAEDAELAVVRTPETQKRRRKVVGCLLQVLALQLTLFGLLAWFVHVHPILPLDVAITRSIQQNQTPGLRITMLAISYPGSSLLLPVLILLTVGAFWAVGDRLEAVFVGGLSTVERSCNGLHRVLGAALRLRHHPLQGKTLVADSPANHLGHVRDADRPLPNLPGRPLGQRCPRCLPDR